MALVRGWKSLALVAAVASSFVAGCRTAEPLPPLTGASPDEKPLSLKVPRFDDGAVHDFASDRGHVVVIDVWATWCEPCRDALPTWQEVQKQYASQGLRIYALSLDEDRNHVSKFIEETKLTLPVLLDTEGIAVPTLKVELMPTTYFIDRKGVVRFKEAGFAEEHLAKYQGRIEQLLAERE